MQNIVDEVVRVELGCGSTKNEGYLGIDRFSLPNVDLVADLNKGIPLEDNSVDVIFCSHSLEHFDSLSNIVNDIYRVCKHKAIINILSPYHMETVNLANIYHKQVFNEATFRFFSKESSTTIDDREYYNPHAASWGLALSDNSEQDTNIQILDMEYFYFPSYATMTDDEKRNARRSLLNVCDQIYYSLAVNKSNNAFTKEEIDELKELAKKEEVPMINIIRNRQNDSRLNSSIIDDIKKWDIELKNEITLNLDDYQRNCEMKFEQKLDISEQDLIHRLKVSERKLLHEINRIESDYNEKILQFEKRIIDKFELLELENNNKFKGVHNQLISLNAEKNSLASISLELIKSRERTSFVYRYFSLFRRKNDLFETISTNYTYFGDGLILLNNNFNKNSIISLSKVIPYEVYFEYRVYGDGNKINFFLFSNKGAKLFLEVVYMGVIIKQESFVVNYEGMYTSLLDENIHGEVYIRFRTLDNISICRVLEIVNRKRGFFEKRNLAGFIE